MEELIIMRYIATWNWIILGIMFLSVGSIAAMLHNTGGMLGFVFVAAGCFYMSIRRKGEVLEDEK